MSLSAELDRTEFVALNICRLSGGGYQASLQRSKGDGYSVRIEPTCSAAVLSALGLETAAAQALPACPLALPACPVGLPT